MYTVLGYSGCDSTEPALPLQISSSVAKAHEYTAHGMWIMAEISGRGHSSYLLQIKATLQFRRKMTLSRSGFESMVPIFYEMTIVKKNRSNDRAIVPPGPCLVGRSK